MIKYQTIFDRVKTTIPKIPTKGAQRVAELASMRLLLKGREYDSLRELREMRKESTTRGITAALMAVEASEILEKIRVNTQRVFTATKDRPQHKFLKLVQEKQASVSKAPSSC